jgi:protein-arginine kinase activator protein McsA
MSERCEKCGKPADVHLTEINDGQKQERHLCRECMAKEEGELGKEFLVKAKEIFRPPFIRDEDQGTR